MNNINRIIQIAEGEVGYCEKRKEYINQNNILDDKTKGAGSDNITKYARDLVNWVGAPYSQGAPWCDMWFDWIMIKAFGLNNAKKLLGGWSAYTPTSAQYYKNMNRWYNVPQVGDQIFFKNATRINHTGLVYQVDSTRVYTIEGNTSSVSGVVSNGGCVAKKSYKLTSINIAGYGRPDYSSIQTPVKTYLYKGIDVSAYQKNINYSAFKTAKIDFAILKIIRKDLAKDQMFETHYSGFSKEGIPIFAVYQYSYATTAEKARNDARTVIKHLEGRRLAVCLDIEDDVQKRLGRALIDIINAYQEVIEAAGLPFLLYTGMSFYNTYIKPYDSGLKCKDIWMARYYKSYTPMTFAEDPSNNYKPMANLVGWQYTSSGQLPGYNGSLDFNIIYRDIKAPAVVSQNITTKVTTKGSKLNVRKAPKTGAIVGKLENGKVIKIMDVRDGWLVIGPEQYVSAMYVSTNTYGTIIANALNIRSSDSTNGSIVGRYIKDEVVPILAQSSTGWYLTPKGWISNNYTKI